MFTGVPGENEGRTISTAHNMCITCEVRIESYCRRYSGREIKFGEQINTDIARRRHCVRRLS